MVAKEIHTSLLGFILGEDQTQTDKQNKSGRMYAISPNTISWALE